MPKILILSTVYTGGGHSSVAASLVEQLAKRDVETVVVDGFDLGGMTGLIIGRSYGFFTRNFPNLFEMYYNWVNRQPAAMDGFIINRIKRRFLALVSDFRPDLIVSVHPAFVGSILTILEQASQPIPLATVVCDLVTFSRLWADHRSEMIFCPGEEAAATCRSWGIPAEKITVSGFPIRERFAPPLPAFKNAEPVEGRSWRFLLTSGGEGSGPLERIAARLLHHFSCQVTILAGRNRSMLRRLSHTLQRQYPNRVTLHGYLDNVEEIIHSHDVGFFRASPNLMLEAINCHLPLVITGALPGQEADNPAYFAARNVAVICSNLEELPAVVKELLADGAVALQRIRENQATFSRPQAAADIAASLKKLLTTI